MTLDELMQKMTDIGTAEDDSTRRLIITEVSDEIRSVFEENETLTTANNDFEAKNKKLQEDNMELFLRVGGQKKSDPIDPGHDPNDDLKYDDLFNEKGELK